MQFTQSLYIAVVLGLASSGVLISAEIESPEPVMGKVPERKEEWVDLLEAGDGAYGLKHWRLVNTAATTFQLARDESNTSILKCDGKPTGILRSAETYENFLVEFEWKFYERDGMSQNSGFFAWSDGLTAKGTPFSRGIEVQVANFDHNDTWFTRHGDIFAIHGAKLSPDPRFGYDLGGQRSMPIEYRAKGTGEWNHYRLMAVDGTLQLEVNGKVVSGGYHALPRKGHLILESEGGRVDFRKLRVLRLPDSPKKLEASELANALDAKTRIEPLYDGVNVADWAAAPESDWKAKDWKLQVNQGEVSRKLDLKAGERLILDLHLSEEAKELPIRWNDEALATPVLLSKGAKRIEFKAQPDLSVRWSLDGVEQSQTLKAAEVLKLGATQQPVSYSSILKISE